MLVRLRSSIGSPTAMNVNFQKQASWGTWLNKCLLLGDTELRQLGQALTLPWKLTWEAVFIRGFQGVFRIYVTEHHDSFHFLSQQPVFRNLPPLWDLHSFVYEVFTKGLKFIVLQKWVNSSQKWVSSVSAWSASPRRKGTSEQWSTRPPSPPSSRSRWSGGTSWGWTNPPPCCRLSASYDPPEKRKFFRSMYRSCSVTTHGSWRVKS